jgi:cell division protein FtsL
MDAGALGRAAITFALLMCALGLVTWRQSRAFEANRVLDDLRRQVTVARAERVEIGRDIQTLRRRARIVMEAEALGMHTPDATEQVFLSAAGGGS